MEKCDMMTLDEMVDLAIANNPNVVADHHKGIKPAIQFLIGQVMRISKGCADPKMTLDILKKKL
jgi:aspartyl-tRNA(Asn)/glutamyl-tRNA(Gln) amidotransferase subunit B